MPTAFSLKSSDFFIYYIRCRLIDLNDSPCNEVCTCNILNVSTFNGRSIRNEVNDLEALAESEDYHIIEENIYIFTF